MWHAKEPSLLNGHKCWAEVKICSPYWQCWRIQMSKKFPNGKKLQKKTPHQTNFWIFIFFFRTTGSISNGLLINWLWFCLLSQKMSKMKITYINDLKKNLLRWNYLASFNHTNKNAFLGGGGYEFYISEMKVHNISTISPIWPNSSTITPVPGVMKFTILVYYFLEAMSLPSPIS